MQMMCQNCHSIAPSTAEEDLLNIWFCICLKYRWLVSKAPTTTWYLKLRLESARYDAWYQYSSNPSKKKHNLKCETWFETLTPAEEPWFKHNILASNTNWRSWSWLEKLTLTWKLDSTIRRHGHDIFSGQAAGGATRPKWSPPPEMDAVDWHSKATRFLFDEKLFPRKSIPLTWAR